MLGRSTAPSAGRPAATIGVLGAALAVVVAISSSGGADSPPAAAAGPGSHPAVASSPAHDGVPAFGHAFLIVGENTSRSQITAAHAPYLTGTLKPQSAWLTRYRAFNNSDSLGQYMAMTSGQFTRCEANDGSPAGCHQDVKSLFGQLDLVPLTWKAWNESADNPCDITDHGSGWAKNVYVAHHEPAVYYTAIEGGVYGGNQRPSAECRQKVVPAGTTAPRDTSAFDAGLASGDIPAFNLVIPNNCENSHDACRSPDRVRQFDDFLAREVPKIEASPVFGSDGVIFIVWDEGGVNHAQVLALATGPLVTPGVYADGPYNHYGLLRTIEDGFALGHIAGARTATPIAGIWM